MYFEDPVYSRIWRRFRICNHIMAVSRPKIDFLRNSLSTGSDSIAQIWTVSVTDVTDDRGRCYFYHVTKAVFCAESDGAKKSRWCHHQNPQCCGICDLPCLSWYSFYRGFVSYNWQIQKIRREHLLFSAPTGPCSSRTYLSGRPHTGDDFFQFNLLKRSWY